MTFLDTPGPDRPGPNYERGFALRPGVYLAWRGLIESITANMDPRRYELATLAAAQQVRSSYCCLSHGRVLLNDEHLTADELVAVVTDRTAAGLDEMDVAVMDLAEKVAADAGSVTEADTARLRGLGLADAEIFDVVLAAAARAFFTKALDSIGVQPDAEFAELDAGLREVLVVGRPIAAT
jgi:alkylhydroperoxidase family enzyme